MRAESLFAALHTHLGVQFESEPGARSARAEPELSDHSRRVALALRLHEAAAIGSVTDLEALAQELAVGDPGEAGLGRQIARLAGAVRLRRAPRAGRPPGRRRARRARDDDRCPDTATILVVDDSPVNLQVLVRTLQASGHRILAARSGRAALEIASRARPDLVLLDVMMPDMDGFEVCRALKARPETREAVVIFLSALGEVVREGLGAEPRRRGLHHQAHSGRGGAGAGHHPPHPAVPRARASPQPRPARSRAGQRRGHAAPAAAAAACRSIRAWSSPRSTRRAVMPAATITTSSRSTPTVSRVVVADVSGHGAPAAIVMAMIRAVLHTCDGMLHDPAAVLHHLNRHFEFLWDTAMFATAVYGVLDVERRTWRSIRAGHPPPLVVGPGQAGGHGGLRGGADAAVRRTGQPCRGGAAPRPRATASCCTPTG